MSLDKLFGIAGSGLAAQSVRLNTTASNLANADDVATSASEVYRAREPVFAAALADSWSQEGSGVEVLGVVERDGPVRREYRPDHPLADDEGYLYQTDVDPVEELANMISASRSYETNVEVLGTAKQLLLRTLRLGQ